MVKKIAAASFAVLLALSARAALVESKRSSPDESLWSLGNPAGTTLSTNQALGGRKLGASRGFIVSGVSLRVGAAGGGGAGNTVITITDGTNTCTATMTCADSQNTGPKLLATANGAGTGCTYAASAGLTASVTTAGCTSTQPGISTLTVVGNSP